MYGLLALYRVDPNPTWLQAAFKGISYLAERYRHGKFANSELYLNHWLMYALKELGA